MTQIKQNINGIEFQINLLPLMTRVRLDIRVARMIAPVLGSLGIAGTADIKDIMHSDIKLDNIADGISRALEALPEHELLSLLRECLACVTAIAPGKPAIDLDSERACEEVFADNHFTIYQVFFAVLKHNKIVPFGLSGIGS